MSITFDLPAAVEQQLRRDVTNLDVLAKEAVLVELYRQGKISHHQLGLAHWTVDLHNDWIRIPKAARVRIPRYSFPGSFPGCCRGRPSCGTSN